MFVSDLARGKRPLCDRSLVVPLARVIGVDPSLIAAQVVRDRRCAVV